MGSNVAAVKKWRLKNRAAGNCWQCKSPALAGHCYCEKHLAINNARVRDRPYTARMAEYQRATRESKKAAGVCRYCTKPVAEGKTSCEYHLEYQRARDVARTTLAPGEPWLRAKHRGPPLVDSASDLQEIAAAAGDPKCKCGLRLLGRDQIAQGHCDSCLPASASEFAYQRRTHWSDEVDRLNIGDIMPVKEKVRKAEYLRRMAAEKTGT